ncbi:MAG: M20/M25/M40 family metallo-hydrolase, partial [Alphaproteobacteria bacterium]|nr:M20/M25/M40 family metallo-hydrolase [Alphaproteobacteria bacterium]
MNAPLEINAKRLEERLYKLGQYGRIEATERGVCSLALSESNIQATIDVIAEMESLGLMVQIDPVGNVFAVRPDKHGNTQRDIILSGSHIDTVPTGGIYDGRLGVEGALEAFRRMNEEGIETDRPVACCIFLAEEGARYQPAMIGSRYFCGLMSEDEALNVRSHIAGDDSRLGVELEVFRARLREAYASGRLQHDYTAWERVDLSRIRSYVELHIEQGPEMEEHGVSVEAVQAVLGISQRIVTLAAEQAKQTALAAFQLVREVREVANTFRGEQRATVGILETTETEPLPRPTNHQLRYTVHGETAHAGGGVMRYRRDAAYAAAVLVERAGM